MANPTITTWNRLEPASRRKDMSAGLQARIYDPLWLLARQWQLGEFQGEDRGSPAMAQWRGESAPLSRYHPGPLPGNGRVEGQPYDHAALPLETLIERERFRPAQNSKDKVRFAAEAGQHFLRLLDLQATSRSYREAFINRFAFPPSVGELDEESRAFLELVTARVPDGRLLYAAIRAALPGLPDNLAIDPSDAAEVQAAAAAWVRWYEMLLSEPGSGPAAWSSERMEYGFAVAARLQAGEKVLAAREYNSGHLDWHDFDVAPGKLLGAPAPAPVTITRTAIPAPVTYRGMPAPRFWEFEDAQVDLGAVTAAPEELARMLLLEFGMSYANDWFVLPLELEVGTLSRTHSLVITNTFGERTLLRPSLALPGPASAFRMFELSTSSIPEGDLYFLPPTLAKSLESRPIEEILLVRDEMANMAWGIERVIESPSERRLDRAGEERGGPRAPVTEGQLAYRLAHDVPRHWTPLVPVQTTSGGLRLRRAVLATGTQEASAARGRILNPEPADAAGLSLFEEEIPREGLRVTRSYQLTRWHDGSTHLWIGRRKQVGRGEASSGLRFDALDGA